MFNTTNKTTKRTLSRIVSSLLICCTICGCKNSKIIVQQDLEQSIRQDISREITHVEDFAAKVRSVLEPYETGHFKGTNIVCCFVEQGRQPNPAASQDTIAKAIKAKSHPIQINGKTKTMIILASELLPEHYAIGKAIHMVDLFCPKDEADIIRNTYWLIKNLAKLKVAEDKKSEAEAILAKLDHFSRTVVDCGIGTEELRGILADLSSEPESGSSSSPYQGRQVTKRLEKFTQGLLAKVAPSYKAYLLRSIDYCIKMCDEAIHSKLVTPCQETGGPNIRQFTRYKELVEKISHTMGFDDFAELVMMLGDDKNIDIDWICHTENILLYLINHGYITLSHSDGLFLFSKNSFCRKCSEVVRHICQLCEVGKHIIVFDQIYEVDDFMRGQARFYDYRDPHGEISSTAAVEMVTGDEYARIIYEPKRPDKSATVRYYNLGRVIFDKV